jgi:hypothetical protein
MTTQHLGRSNAVGWQPDKYGSNVTPHANRRMETDTVTVPRSKAHARHPTLAPLIEAQLPDDRPLSVRAIHARIGIGAPSTVRNILCVFVRAGLAQAVSVPCGAATPRRLYRKAPEATL